MKNVNHYNSCYLLGQLVAHKLQTSLPGELTPTVGTPEIGLTSDTRGETSRMVTVLAVSLHNHVEASDC